MRVSHHLEVHWRPSIWCEPKMPVCNEDIFVDTPCLRWIGHHFWKPLLWCPFPSGFHNALLYVKMLCYIRNQDRLQTPIWWVKNGIARPYWLPRVTGLYNMYLYTICLVLSTVWHSNAYLCHCISDHVSEMYRWRWWTSCCGSKHVRMGMNMLRFASLVYWIGQKRLFDYAWIHHLLYIDEQVSVEGQKGMVGRYGRGG